MGVKHGHSPPGGNIQNLKKGKKWGLNGEDQTPPKVEKPETPYSEKRKSGGGKLAQKRVKKVPPTKARKGNALLKKKKAV